MSFYTSLTGLNAATAMLGVTSNNIANVGTTGFKRSRADFGDIFATSPLQKASSTVGQGVSLKQVSLKSTQSLNFPSQPEFAQRRQRHPLMQDLKIVCLNFTQQSSVNTGHHEARLLSLFVGSR